MDVAGHRWMSYIRTADQIIGIIRRGVPSSSAVSSSASSSPATSTHASVPVALLNATPRLIDARSSVVEPLQPAGGGRPVGGRSRADSAGSSESLNLCEELGQLQAAPALRIGLPANPAVFSSAQRESSRGPSRSCISRIPS